MKIEEIILQKEAAEKGLFKLNGVNGVEVGYKYSNGKRTDEISIRVLVNKKKKTVSGDQKIPSEINGIKTDVIEQEIVPFHTSVKLDEASVLADTTKYSTLKGGISIGPERVIGGYVFTGTLGAVVKDNVSGNQMLLSNFHVMCVDNNWNIGDEMCQPSRVDTGVPVTDRVGLLHRATLSSRVDGAISTISGRPTDCSIEGIGDVKGTASAVLNAAVKKRGRTTLLTSGFVDAISATVNVNYGPAIGIKTFTNQIGIRPNTAANPKFSASGDSGSVVVNSDNKVIGLLFAGNSTSGYTYINPISSVLSELNISLCVKSTIMPKAIKDISDGRKSFIKDLGEGGGKLRIFDKNPKEFKNEKVEIKEHNEKPPILENKNIRENDWKFKFNEGSVEQRLGAIEQNLASLSAFIGSDLRPDLNSGALNNEEDVNEIRQKMEKRYSR